MNFQPTCTVHLYHLQLLILYTEYAICDEESYNKKERERQQVETCKQEKLYVRGIQREFEIHSWIGSRG